MIREPLIYLLNLLASCNRETERERENETERERE